MDAEKKLELLLTYGWIPVAILLLFTISVIVYVLFHFISKWW